LEGCIPPYDNTHFENRSWLNNARNFQAVDCLTIVGTENFIIAPLHELISRAVFAVSIDDIKDLAQNM
jgi:hypothetical protein